MRSLRRTLQASCKPKELQNNLGRVLNRQCLSDKIRSLTKQLQQLEPGDPNSQLRDPNKFCNWWQFYSRGQKPSSFVQLQRLKTANRKYLDLVPNQSAATFLHLFSGNESDDKTAFYDNMYDEFVTCFTKPGQPLVKKEKKRRHPRKSAKSETVEGRSNQAKSKKKKKTSLIDAYLLHKRTADLKSEVAERQKPKLRFKEAKRTTSIIKRLGVTSDKSSDDTLKSILRQSNFPVNQQKSMSTDPSQFKRKSILRKSSISTENRSQDNILDFNESESKSKIELGRTLTHAKSRDQMGGPKSSTLKFEKSNDSSDSTEYMTNLFRSVSRDSNIKTAKYIKRISEPENKSNHNVHRSTKYPKRISATESKSKDNMHRSKRKLAKSSKSSDSTDDKFKGHRPPNKRIPIIHKRSNLNNTKSKHKPDSTDLNTNWETRNSNSTTSSEMAKISKPPDPYHTVHNIYQDWIEGYGKPKSKMPKRGKRTSTTHRRRRSTDARSKSVMPTYTYRKLPKYKIMKLSDKKSQTVDKGFTPVDEKSMGHFHRDFHKKMSKLATRKSKVNVPKRRRLEKKPPIVYERAYSIYDEEYDSPRFTDESLYRRILEANENEEQLEGFDRSKNRTPRGTDESLDRKLVEINIVKGIKAEIIPKENQETPSDVAELTQDNAQGTQLTKDNVQGAQLTKDNVQETPEQEQIDKIATGKQHKELAKHQKPMTQKEKELAEIAQIIKHKKEHRQAKLRLLKKFKEYKKKHKISKSSSARSDVTITIGSDTSIQSSQMRRLKRYQNLMRVYDSNKYLRTTLTRSHDQQLTPKDSSIQALLVPIKASVIFPVKGPTPRASEMHAQFSTRKSSASKPSVQLVKTKSSTLRPSVYKHFEDVESYLTSMESLPKRADKSKHSTSEHDLLSLTSQDSGLESTDSKYTGKQLKRITSSIFWKLTSLSYENGNEPPESVTRYPPINVEQHIKDFMSKNKITFDMFERLPKNWPCQFESKLIQRLRDGRHKKAQSKKIADKLRKSKKPSKRKHKVESRKPKLEPELSKTASCEICRRFHHIEPDQPYMIEMKKRMAREELIRYYKSKFAMTTGSQMTQCSEPDVIQRNQFSSQAEPFGRFNRSQSLHSPKIPLEPNQGPKSQFRQWKKMRQKLVACYKMLGDCQTRLDSRIKDIQYRQRCL